MPRLLGDADLQRLLPPERALSLVRAALTDVESGRLIAPARVASDVGLGRLTFTCGAVPGDWFGFRSYLAPGDAGDEQVVVVQDAATGAVRAVYAGEDLGPRRTGAIGGVAVDTLAAPGPVSLGLVGTGRQAWEQVVAIHAARGIEALRVHSRAEERRVEFAIRARTELGIPSLASATARDAVDGMPVVVLATSSAEPVVELDWLAAAEVVSTLGPKQVDRHEFPLGLAAWADRLVTDSVAQVLAYDPPSILAGTPEAERLVSLGSLLTDEPASPVTSEPVSGRPRGRAVFFSVGLAGTEVHLLNAITQP